jgi:hypothetical protein
MLLEATLRQVAEEIDSSHWITAAAVRRALEAGIGIKDYLATLGDMNSGPLPVCLESRIKRWGGFYGPAALQEAVVLEVRDSAVVDELLNDPTLSTMLSRFPSDNQGRLLLVTSNDLESVRGALRRYGIDLKV